MSLERNLKISFAEVRKDILEVKNEILKLAERQEKLEADISALGKKPAKKTSKKKR